MTTDRRALKSNGRVAHSSLEGQVQAEHFTDGESWQVVTGKAVLSDAEGIKRERELILGQKFRVLEVLDRMAFGFSEHNGYVGYVDTIFLAQNMPEPTHRVAVPMTIAKAGPDLKAKNEVAMFSHGSEVAVIGRSGDWAEISSFTGDDSDQPGSLWIPRQHLVVRDRLYDDPAAVAEMYLGTPYLWGGNSVFGLDCSGLVQAACLACGIPCPGDSDQQQAALGVDLPRHVPLQRNDLLFWKGHTGIVVSDEMFLHANAHHMQVAYEPLDQVFSRIGSRGEDSVARRARLDLVARR